MRRVKSKGMLCLGAAALVITSSLALGVPKPKVEDLDLPGQWQDVSPKERLKAVKVAEIDAIRKLAERIRGFRLESGATVNDFVLASQEVESALDTKLKGATQTEAADYKKDGRVQVVYGVKLREVLEVIKKHVEKTESGDIKKLYERKLEHKDKLIEALGNGALPESQGMKRIRAKRAAEMDAYSKMARRVIGVKINNETTVRDMCLENDKIQASITGFLRGIKPTSIRYTTKNACEVTMQLKKRKVIETVKTITNYYRKGDEVSKEKIRDVNHDIVDTVFKVTGHGAPGDKLPGGQENDGMEDKEAFKTEKTIIKRVIDKGVVVE